MFILEGIVSIYLCCVAKIVLISKTSIIFVKAIAKNMSSKRRDTKPANLLLTCDFYEILQKFP